MGKTQLFFFLYLSEFIKSDFNFRKQKMSLRIKKYFLPSILQTRSIIIRFCQRQNSIQLRYSPSFQIEKLTKQKL